MLAGCSDDAVGTFDAPPADALGIDARIDARLPTDAPTDAPTACTVSGTYTVTFGGNLFYFVFNVATGMWGADVTAAEAETSPGSFGAFDYAAGAFSITDTSNPFCVGIVGQYSVSFTPTCAFTVTLVADACAGRASSLAGATFTPVP